MALHQYHTFARKPGLSDKTAIKIALLAGGAAAVAGTFFGAPDANADPQTNVEHSIQVNRVVICQAFDKFGPAATPKLALALLATGDLSLKQVASVMVVSVQTTCPDHVADLTAWADAQKGA